MIVSIEHIGHAGFIYQYGSTKIVMDPWFWPAYFEAWAPYPDNAHFMLAATAAANENWVYVSHHHPDHFDKQFLRGLNHGTRVIVPRFRSRRMERLFRDMTGFQVHALGHGESLKLSDDVTVTMLLDRGYREDSALLVDARGHRFLNVNDCELARPDIPNDVDVVTGQYAGASWYPQCYEHYSHDEYMENAAELRHAVFRRLKDLLKYSGARIYVPSAGPPQFPDPALERFNAGEAKGHIFWEWNYFATEILRTQGVSIGPYMRYPEDPIGSRRCLWQGARGAQFRAFYTRPANPATLEEVNDHFRKLLKGNARLMRDYERSVQVGPVRGEFTVQLSLLADEVEEVPEPSYWVRTPPQVLRAILDGTDTWENALASQRCSLSRTPDTYDSTLMALLTCGDEPGITRHIAAVRDKPPPENISRDGYVLPRWCPHDSEDLTEAPIDGCELTCPRHGWKWDLKTGKCISGGDISLWP